jgi:phenylacetate-CoA ligase
VANSAAQLAPAARIVRHTASQRPLLPAVLQAAAELRQACRGGPDGSKAELNARLLALAGTLVESPYYRESLQARGLSPHDLRTLEDLPHFPILERRTLVERGDELLALPVGDRRASELVLVRSSGSTGEPVTVPRTRLELVHMWAVLRFWLDWLGLDLPRRPRVVLLDGLPGGLEYSVRLPLLEDGALHRLSLLRSGLLERLRRARPALLFSDPEGLHWLASQALGQAPQPLLLLSSASQLAPELRARLALAQRAPVLDYYATTETGPIAWDCLRRPGRFHVLLPDVWVESQQGELLVTRLRASAWPLLRYRTGDRGQVEREACDCGYRGLSIVGFEGRRACHFVRPDGRRVDAWQLAWLFKQHALRGFRLTQTGPADFALALSAVERPDLDALAAQTRAALQALGWPHATVLATWRSGAHQQGKPEPFVREGF